MKIERIEQRWPGALCIVAATGPSLTPEIADRCRGHRCVAVNDAWRLFSFADVLYAGDRDWWEYHEGCPGFAGEKWCAHHDRDNDNRAIAHRFGIRLVRGCVGEGFSFDSIRVHYGSNSGFQAVNLALLFGATTIVLVGFDMHVPANAPRHFFGDHPAPMHNVSNYRHFIPDFRRAADALPKNISIINCTPGSALDCFPILKLDDVLQ